MEFANVEAGIRGMFENTMELKPMKYKEAIIGQMETPGQKK